VTTVRRQLAEAAFVIFHIDGAGLLVGASGIGTGNSIARDVKLAEMLIGRQASPAPEALADPAVQLKALLKG
jgi:3-phenylpropionate/trans-cinnamate dioxygenase ferredoxin reductase subunit